MIRLRSLGLLFKVGVGEVLGLVGSQGYPQDRQLLAGLEPPEALGGLQHGGRGPAQHHLGILPAFDPRLRGGRLLWQTCRMVPFMFSMTLVQASERRNSTGRPRRAAVRISSMPSRMLAETPGASPFQASGEIVDQLLSALVGPALHQHKLHLANVYGFRRDQANRVFLKND